MTKQELIDAVAEACSITKDNAKMAVDTMFGQIKSAMKQGHDVRLPDRNPATGATIKIPASNVPKFTPAKGLKEAVN